MAKDPLKTKFAEMMGIEFPIIAFTHCKDVVAAVVNAGGFAVLGEAMHTPDDIADDINRSVIRDQVEMGVAFRMACLDMLTRDRAFN